jgi:streptothricin acetyltransferase
LLQEEAAMKDSTKQSDIVELNHENLKDVNVTDNAFEVKSRIIPYIEGGVFHYHLKDIEKSYTKSYGNDDFDYTTYIDNPEKIVYLVYAGNSPAGQIILRRNWNKYAYIEDIRIGSEYRRTGIGTRLMETALEWAKIGHMPGIMLETQDINVPACKFYESCGFELGGVDVYLYKGVTPVIDEIALYWYKFFQTLPI